VQDERVRLNTTAISKKTETNLTSTRFILKSPIRRLRIKLGFEFTLLYPMPVNSNPGSGKRWKRNSSHSLLNWGKVLYAR
jgi:hypothetical protein